MGVVAFLESLVAYDQIAATSDFLTKPTLAAFTAVDIKMVLPSSFQLNSCVLNDYQSDVLMALL